jgi:hypothetical protein
MVGKQDLEEQRPANTCGCGRSPVGHCIGWHGLTEDEFRQKLAQWDANVIAKNNIVE